MLLNPIKKAYFDATPPASAEVDMSSPGGPIPHPGLDGKRIKPANSNNFYFVWQGGYKCWIPDSITYESLFASWDRIEVIAPDEIVLITDGSPITSEALLARANNSALVYLVTNGTKNLVSSPSVMSYCHFNWPPVYPTPLVDFIPTGITIDYGD